MKNKWDYVRAGGSFRFRAWFALPNDSKYAYKMTQGI